MQARNADGDIPDDAKKDDYLKNVQNWNKIANGTSTESLKYLYCVADDSDPGTYRIGHGWDFYIPDSKVWDYYKMSDSEKGKPLPLKRWRDFTGYNFECLEPKLDFVIYYAEGDEIETSYLYNDNFIHLESSFAGCSSPRTIYEDGTRYRNECSYYAVMTAPFTHRYSSVMSARNGNNVNGIGWCQYRDGDDACDEYFPYYKFNDRGFWRHIYACVGNNDAGSWENPIYYSNAVIRSDTSSHYFNMGDYNTFPINAWHLQYQTKSVGTKYTYVTGKTSGCSGTVNIGVSVQNSLVYARAVRFSFEVVDKRTLFNANEVWNNPNWVNQYVGAYCNNGKSNNDPAIVWEIYDYDTYGSNGDIYLTKSLLHPYMYPAVRKDSEPHDSKGCVLNYKINGVTFSVNVDMTVHKDISIKEKGLWKYNGRCYYED